MQNLIKSFLLAVSFTEENGVNVIMKAESFESLFNKTWFRRK